MTKELKIVIAAAIGVGLFFAFNSFQAEYARIQLRVEVTQAKVDQLADELANTTRTVNDAIRSITDRFLLLEQDAAPESEDRSSESVQTVKQTSSVPTILMHCGYSCGSCNAWISIEMPKWRQSGWRVEILKELDSTRGFPWYEIIDRDGKRMEVDGPLTNEKFQAAKAGAK